MVTQLPSSGVPPIGEGTGCDTSGMVVVHRMLRRSFADAPGLVRGVPAGDRTRATIIGNHMAEIAHGLHEHHLSEDEMLWDRLESRSPGCAAHVAQMRAQHAAVAVLLDRLNVSVPVWRLSADPSDASTVAETLDEVFAALFAHLGNEEDLILPVAAHAMTQHEWDALGERGRASIPKSRLMIQLGFILQSFTPAEREEWMRVNLPGFVRMLYALFGRRQYERYYRIIYGTSPA